MGCAMGDEKGQGSVFLILVLLVIAMVAICAISGNAVLTDPSGNIVIGKPEQFAEATAIAKASDMALVATRVAVSYVATQNAANGQATATAAAVQVAATREAIAQQIQATATIQAGVVGTEVETKNVNLWAVTCGVIGGLVVFVLTGLGAVAWVNRKANSVYPNAAGQYPVIIRKVGNTLTMHDPNRGLGPTAVYTAPGLIERIGYAIAIARGLPAPQPGIGAAFPTPGSEPTMAQLATQAQAVGLMAAATRPQSILPVGEVRKQEDTLKLVQAVAGNLTAPRMPSITVIDDPQKLIETRQMLLESEGGNE